MGDRERTKSGDGRGRLPRTNRPRPQQARRPAERISGTHIPTHESAHGKPRTDADGPELAFEEIGRDEDESLESGDGPELEVSESSQDGELFASDDAIAAQSAPSLAESRDSGTRLGATALGDASPATRRDGAAPIAGFSPATLEATSLEELAQRPTQLDARTDAETRRAVPTTTLRRVTFARAAGSTTADSGPGANAYIGYVIDGRYRIDSVIGRGGMGVVYKARHEVIDKIFAVKILLPTEDTEVVERFVNEARAATAIGNAHIVDTVDFGQLPDGSTYFVMELLEGTVLNKIIRADKFIPVQRAVNIAKQIAEAMAAAHAANIVHRDLKPENIYITQREKVGEFIKLLDFGIAKIANAQNKLTRAGTIFGTPHYMSPEQAAGIEVDPRTDIYSLGVILYEMVAGRVPFEAENPMGLLTQHMYVNPKPMSELENLPQSVPIALDAIVLKCLAKKPEERYASMTDLHADLDRFERGALPTAISELVSRMDEAEHRALVRAAKDAITAGKKASRWPRVVLSMLLLGGAAGGTAYYLKLHPRVEDALPEVVVPETPAHSEPVVPVTLPPVPKTPAAEIAIVFSPVDAQVFRGNALLGTIPVTLQVNEGEGFDVEIRREGFFTQKVHIDGSKTLVKGQLNPIPGVKPANPVPDDSPDKFRAWADAILAQRKVEQNSENAEPSPSAARPAEHAAPRAARPDGGAPRKKEAPSEPRPSEPNPYGEEAP